jgi:crotonobetainyl-CoA:carnitine CoA-transferase CaiB-like acyl-CoA transferase
LTVLFGGHLFYEIFYRYPSLKPTLPGYNNSGCAPVKSLAEAWDEKQVRSKGLLAKVEDARYGVREHLRSPLTFNGEPLSMIPAPDPGQDNDEIYGTLQIDEDTLKRPNRKHMI